MTAEYLYRREMEHVLACLTPANRRVCRVCVETGLRVGDVVAITTEQLRRGPQFWITEQKTGKRRKVRLRDALWRDLMAHAGKVWVWPGYRDPVKSHRTRQAVWQDVRRAAKAYRLPQHVSPHSLRKLYAVEMLDRAHGDLSRVQRALNHSDAATTMIYVMSYQVYMAKYGGGTSDSPQARRRATQS